MPSCEHMLRLRGCSSVPIPQCTAVFAKTLLEAPPLASAYQMTMTHLPSHSGLSNAHILLYMQFIPSGLCTNVKEIFPWVYQARLNQLVQIGCDVILSILLFTF